METSSVTARPPDGQSARARVHDMWASVAGSWGAYAEYADTRAAAVSARMLEFTAPRPGDGVLELACGAGGIGLAAARLVAPGGEVVLSDVVPQMTAIAQARATTLGLGNVRTRVLDLEHIDQPDSSYDVVLCREGLMFAFDPARAAREIHRVLRPGGRTALAVWGARAGNPWLSVVFDTVSAQLGRPVPPPGIPGPFSLDDPARLAGLLRDAGLIDVVVTELPTPLHAASFDAWWSRTSALAGPLAAVLAALPDEAVRALRARLKEAVRPYESPTGIDFPGLNLLATARRASRQSFRQSSAALPPGKQSKGSATQRRDRRPA